MTEPPRNRPTNSSTTPSLSTTDDWPSGCILRVEPQTAHKAFLDATKHVEYVMLSIDNARVLVDRGETATSYFGPDIAVIVTTTMHDSHLDEWDWTQELETIKAFHPDFHIPTDYPVYWGYTPSQRRTNIRKCLKGTLWFLQELADCDITVIPLLKGLTPEERILCYKVFQKFGITYCAFYATQFFTSGRGITPLTDTLRRIATEAPELKILLIGLLAPSRLVELPPQIVAAAGLTQWINRVALRNSDITRQYQQDRFTELQTEVQEACTEGQTPLKMWTEEPLYEAVIHG